MTLQFCLQIEMSVVLTMEDVAIIVVILLVHITATAILDIDCTLINKNA